MSMSRPPPFHNDMEFRDQLEQNIPPNHHFPYVKLQLLPHIPKVMADSSSQSLELKTRSTRSKFPHTFSEKAKLSPKLPQTHHNIFKCPVCHVTFKSLYNVGIHIKSNHTEVSKPFLCFTCSSSFEKNNDLKCHLLTQHPTDFRAYNNSSKIYTSSGERKVHPKLQDLTWIQCPKCPQKFPSQSSLRVHMTKHSKQTPWMCKRFGRRLKSFQIHQKAKRSQSLASRRFNCTYCDMVFNTEETRTIHHKNQHGIEPTSSITGSILSFIKTSDGKFEGIKCEKTMAKDYMDVDLKLYCSETTQPPLDPQELKCTQCPQTFKLPTEKQYHEETHGDKYLCPYCTTGFNRNTSLNIHKLRFHKKSACFLCNLECDSLEALLSHKEKVHGAYENTSSTLPGPSDETVDIGPVIQYPEPESSPTKNKSPPKINPATVTKSCFKCTLCDKTYPYSYFLINHMNREHRYEATNTERIFSRSEVETPTPAPVTKSKKNKNILSQSNLSELEHCSFCPAFFTNSFQKQKHERSHGDKHFCPFCTTGFKFWFTLKRHILLFHDKSACLVCRLDFGTPEALKSHQDEVHNIYKRESSTQPETLNETVDIGPELRDKVTEFLNPVKLQHPCSYCPATFKFSSQKENHEKTHGDKFVCQFCTTGFKFLLSLKTHILLFHNKSDCSVCRLDFGTQEALISHQEKVHSIYRKNDTCTQPGNLKATVDIIGPELQDKVTTPLDRVNFHHRCSHCPETFEVSSKKHQHEMTHGDKHLCPYCTTGFNVWVTLKKHILRFHDKLACLVCCLEFDTLEALKSHHEEVHTSYITSDSCTQHGTLTLIETVNIEPELQDKGTTPLDLDPVTLQHRCSHCPETFEFASKKHQHEMTHGDKHLCPYCTTGFNVWVTLKKHILRFHDKSACLVCCLDFDTLEALKSHQEEVHTSYKKRDSGTQPGALNASVYIGPELQDKVTPRPPLNPVNLQHSCSHCPATFNCYSNKRKHENSHGDKHLCPFCTTGFNVWVTLKRHILLYHKETVCLVCRLDFGTPEALLTHLEEVHEIYKNNFSNQPDPLNDSAIIGPQLFVIYSTITPMTQIQTPTITNMCNKVTIVPDDCKFKCTLCNTGFTLEENLIKHQNTTHNVQRTTSDINSPGIFQQDSLSTSTVPHQDVIYLQTIQRLDSPNLVQEKLKPSKMGNPPLHSISSSSIYKEEEMEIDPKALDSNCFVVESNLDPDVSEIDIEYKFSTD